MVCMEILSSGVVEGPVISLISDCCTITEVTEVAEDFPASIFKEVKEERDFSEDTGRKFS